MADFHLPAIERRVLHTKIPYASENRIRNHKSLRCSTIRRLRLINDERTSTDLHTAAVLHSLVCYSSSQTSYESINGSTKADERHSPEIGWCCLQTQVLYSPNDKLWHRNTVVRRVSKIGIRWHRFFWCADFLVFATSPRRFSYSSQLGWVSAQQLSGPPGSRGSDGDDLACAS